MWWFNFEVQFLVYWWMFLCSSWSREIHWFAFLLLRAPVCSARAWLCNSWSKANVSFQFIASYVWYSMENLAGDLLFGLKFVKLSILPTLFILLFSTGWENWGQDTWVLKGWSQDMCKGTEISTVTCSITLYNLTCRQRLLPLNWRKLVDVCVIQCWANMKLSTEIRGLSNTPRLSQMNIPGVRSCPMDWWRNSEWNEVLFDSF